MQIEYDIPYIPNEHQMQKIGENIARQAYHAEPNFKYVEVAGFEVQQ